MVFVTEAMVRALAVLTSSEATASHVWKASMEKVASTSARKVVKTTDVAQSMVIVTACQGSEVRSVRPVRLVNMDKIVTSNALSVVKEIFAALRTERVPAQITFLVLSAIPVKKGNME